MTNTNAKTNGWMNGSSNRLPQLIATVLSYISYICSFNRISYQFYYAIVPMLQLIGQRIIQAGGVSSPFQMCNE